MKATDRYVVRYVNDADQRPVITKTLSAAAAAAGNVHTHTRTGRRSKKQTDSSAVSRQVYAGRCQNNERDIQPAAM